MTDDRLKNAFGTADRAFVDAVDKTLYEIRKTEEESIVKSKIKVGLVFAILIVILLAAAGLAATRLGVLDFIIGRYAEDIQVLPSVGQIIREDVEYSPAHTKFADFNVRQAVFDGQYAYIVVAVTPADDKTLLLGVDSDPDMPVSDFGPRFEEKLGTIQDYANEIGATLIAHTEIESKSESEVFIESSAYMLEEDGTLVYMLTGGYTGDGDEANVVLLCLANDYAKEETERVYDTEIGTLSFTLKAAEGLGEATSVESVEFSDCGVRVDEVRLSATPMAVYTTILFTVIDEEKYALTDGGLWFEFLDENGQRIAQGASAGGSVSPLDDKETRFEQKDSLSAMEKLPDAIKLRGYNCWEKNLYETHEIALR